MQGPLTKFEKWMLRRIARRMVAQGPKHQQNITEAMAIITCAAREEFREDNDRTLFSFIRECFEEACDRTFSYHR